MRRRGNLKPILRLPLFNMNKNNSSAGGKFSNVNFFQSNSQPASTPSPISNYRNGKNIRKGYNTSDQGNTPNRHTNSSGPLGNHPNKSSTWRQQEHTDQRNRGNSKRTNSSDTDRKIQRNNTGRSSRNKAQQSYQKKQPNSQKKQLQGGVDTSIPKASVCASVKSSENTFQSNHFGNKSDTFEVKYFGNLFKAPETLGFQKIQHRPQRTPKYMLKENVLFDMSSYEINKWDLENQKILNRRELEYSGDPQLLFEEFVERRSKEREMMEKFNLVDKENAKKSLDDAIVFRGSCEDMCPTYERVERVYKNQVSKWEKDPATGQISRNLAIKTFMRPSGQAPPLPSDVRTPMVLQKTLNYIIENLLPRLPESQSFIWDRTRSIRQDFTFQNNYSGIESIDCHEKICRIHILSLHVMAGVNDPDYQQQQEVEQFNNSLQTLTHMYQAVRSRGGYCPNEPEFRAYEIMSKIRDSELDRYLQTLPQYIQNNKIVQQAIKLKSLIVEGMNTFNCYTEFFRSVLDRNKTPFLLASISEIYFNEIRYNAFRCISRAYHSKTKLLPTVENLVSWLGYNDVEQLSMTCKLYGLSFINDQDTNAIRVDITALKASFKPSQPQAYTNRISDMINGQSMSQIVNSGMPNKSLNLKTSLTTEQVARESFKGSKVNTEKTDLIFKGFKLARLLEPSVESGFQSFGVPATSFSTNNNELIPANANFVGFQNGQCHNLSSFSSANPSIKLPIQNSRNPKNNFEEAPHLHTPTFNFGAAVTLPTDLNVKSIPSTFKNEKSDITNPPVLSPKKVDIVTPVETSFPVSQNPPKRKLIDNPDFKSQAIRIVNDISTQVVVKISNKLIKEQVEKEFSSRKKLKKSILVANLSNELFSAFMKEQLYLAALEGRAIATYNRNLKTRILSSIIIKARNALIRKELAQAKLNEVEKFSSDVVKPVVFPKNIRKSIRPTNLLDFNVQMKIFKIDLKNMLEKLEPIGDLSTAVILRERRSQTSKWLLSQLGLLHKSKVEVKNDSNYKLTVELLPENFIPEEYFKGLSSILIQVGTLEGLDNSDKDTLIKCLKRDAKVLAKLQKYLTDFSGKPQFSFVIVYSDAYGYDLPFSAIKSLLMLDNLTSSGITIGFYKLNSLSILQKNSNLSIMKKLGDDFGKVLEQVWAKMCLKSKMLESQSNNSINYVSGMNITSGSMSDATSKDDNSAMAQKSSGTVKRKLGYLHQTYADTKSKRRSYRRTHPLLNASISNSFRCHLRSTASVASETHSKNTNSSVLSSYNNSLMEILNESLRDTSNAIHTEAEIAENKKRLQRVQELSELDVLAENVLNS